MAEINGESPASTSRVTRFRAGVRAIARKIRKGPGPEKVLGWWEPRVLQRIFDRAYAPAIRRELRHFSMCMFPILYSVSIGGILLRWVEGKPILQDWALLLFLPPIATLLMTAFIRGIVWLAPREIILTTGDLRRINGFNQQYWKWDDLARAEIARCVLNGAERRVLQLYPRHPQEYDNPAQIGIATKISNERLQFVLQEHNIPLVLTDQPPAGMERWQ